MPSWPPMLEKWLKFLYKDGNLDEWFTTISEITAEQIRDWIELNGWKFLKGVRAQVKKSKTRKNKDAINRPKVGVGLVIRNSSGQILLGPRISLNKPGAGKMALPGGNLEYGETWAKAAIKETEEETGLNINKNSINILHVTNDITESEKSHYITIYLECRLKKDKDAGKIISKEVYKHPWWDWFTLEQIKELKRRGKLLTGFTNLIDSGRLDGLLANELYKDKSSWWSRCKK